MAAITWQDLVAEAARNGAEDARAGHYRRQPFREGLYQPYWAAFDAEVARLKTKKGKAA